MKYYFTYSKLAANEKPKGGAATDQDKRKPTHVAYHQIGWNYETAILDIETMYKVPTSGHSFRQGIYDWAVGGDSKYRRFAKENVLGTNLIVLDFDNCPFTPEIMVKLAEERLMKPNFWYYSFSQGKKPGFNFRMVWVLDGSIRAMAYPLYIAAMLELFPEADPAAKDISRLWFGGTAGQLLDCEPKPISEFKIAEERVEVIDDIFKGIDPSELDNEYVDSLLDVSDYDWVPVLRRHWPLFNRFLAGEKLNYGERSYMFGHLFLMYERDIPISYYLFNLVDKEIYSDSDNYNLPTIERQREYTIRKMGAAKLRHPIIYMEPMLFGGHKRRAFYKPVDFIKFLIESGNIKRKFDK